MFNVFKSTTEVPVSNETKSVEVARIWTVTWTSRHGEFSSDTKKQQKVFLSSNEAQHFAEALDAAFKLLRFTSGTKVTVEEQT
jgi:hypothetical protein